MREKKNQKAEIERKKIVLLLIMAYLLNVGSLGLSVCMCVCLHGSKCVSVCPSA